MEFTDFLSPYYDFYNAETKLYTNKRGAGLYAVLNWMVRAICLLELKGDKVEKVEMFLNEYASNVELFNTLFDISSQELKLPELTESQKMDFLKISEYSNTGLSENPKHLNLEITNQIISKFFNPKQEVLDWYNIFINHIGCDVNDIIFIWARRTDKSSESKIPSVDEYLRMLSTINFENKKVLIQTDDHSVLEEFKTKNLSFYTLPQIPLPKDKDKPFHVDLWLVSDEDFKKIYGITKIDHLRQMVALSLIAKNAHKSIIYPGNPTTFIPLFKGSFDDCILYKDDINLF